MGNATSVLHTRSPSTVALMSLLISSGFAAVWLFYIRINQATRLDNLREKCFTLEHSIDALREELEELRALTRAKRLKGSDEESISRKSIKTKNGPLSTVSTTETEYQSAWSENAEDPEEFFDVYDDMAADAQSSR